MKIRKTIYILIIISLLFVLLAHAENDQKRIGINLSDENGELRLITTMVPDQPYSVNLPEGIESQDLFNMIRPDILPKLIDCFAETIMARNNENSKKVQKGFFSGDLFEQASEKQVIDINKEDMQLLLTDLINRIQEKDMDAATINSLDRIMQLCVKQIYGNETRTSICSYDQGRYLTVSFGRKQDTILSISADFSEKDTYRIVIGRGTADAVYYDEIICKKNNMETEYVFSLFRTTAPTFRMVREQDCVQFEEIRITDQDNKAFEFEGEIHSVLLPEATVITGYRHAEEEKVSIEINFGDYEEEITGILKQILFALMTP